MRARFIGDPSNDGEGPRALHLFGLVFPHGKWVDVSASPVAMTKLPKNRHFETDGGKAEAAEAAPVIEPKRRGRQPRPQPEFREPEPGEEVAGSDDGFTDLDPD